MPNHQSPVTGHQDGASPVLITGGRGRLAGLVADWFGRPGGAEVRLFSREPGPGLAALEDLWATETLATGGVLLHLAWSSLPATAEQQPDLHAELDLGLLRRLLAALEAVPAPRRPHFVFFSTGGAVYGNAPGRPNREDDACHPVGHYGRTKLKAEDEIRAWAARTGAGHTILRIANPYGFTVPELRPQGIIPHAIHAALAGTPLTLWGDGTARKDFLHCGDFLTALDLVVTRRPVGTFNLSQGESHTINEVLAEVERQTGRSIKRLHSPAVSWDVHDSRLDNSKLCAATGWAPRVALTEGVRRSLEERV